jgi:glutamate---cysteine ligase / carboxylate-amine ligase
MLTSLVNRLSDDASALGCLTEVEHCKLILERGSSADHQLRAYREAGDDVRAVTKWIASATAPDQTRHQAPPWHEAVI